MAMRADPNRCLLLIDDEPAQRRLVTAIGARAGWWVRGASDFDAAKKMFDDPQEPRFDAILLDHWLPGEAVRPAQAGPILFAGEQVSDAFSGFMNGALQTGRIAAQALLAQGANRAAA
jgi:monoamine oxidase